MPSDFWSSAIRFLVKCLRILQSIEPVVSDSFGSDHKVETARIFKTCKFGLYPTDEQAARLNHWFASVRWVYNAALELRETYGRRKGTDLHGRPSIIKGCGKKTNDVIIQDSEAGWRMLADDPDLAWLTDLPSVCRQIALQDLDKAFDRFSSGRAGIRPSGLAPEQQHPVSVPGRLVCQRHAFAVLALRRTH